VPDGPAILASVYTLAEDLSRVKATGTILNSNLSGPDRSIPGYRKTARARKSGQWRTGALPFPLPAASGATKIRAVPAQSAPGRHTADPAPPDAMRPAPRRGQGAGTPGLLLHRLKLPGKNRVKQKAAARPAWWSAGYGADGQYDSGETRAEPKLPALFAACWVQQKGAEKARAAVARETPASLATLIKSVITPLFIVDEIDFIEA